MKDSTSGMCSSDAGKLSLEGLGIQFGVLPGSGVCFGLVPEARPDGKARDDGGICGE